MRGEGVAEQAGTVFHFAAFGGLFTELAAGVDVLGVDPRFGPVNFRIGVQPVVSGWRNAVAKLGIALNGGTIGYRVTAAGIRGLRVFRLLRVVVVVAQGAAQRLCRIDFPAAFRQHIVDGFVVWCPRAVALANVAAIAAGPGDQTVQGIGAAIGAGAHPDAVIARCAGSKDAIAAVFTCVQQIAGVDGVIRNHAAQRAAAVQQGGRTTYYFNTFDQRRIEERAVQVSGIGTLAYAIHQHQYATAVIAPKVNVLAVGAPGAVQRQTGHLAQQVGGGAGGLVFWRAGVNHAHHHGGFKGAAGIAGGGDGDLVCGGKRNARQGADNRQRQKRRT